MRKWTRDDWDGFTEGELRRAEEMGLEFLVPPAPEPEPVRYSGNAEYIAFNWEAVWQDFMLLGEGTARWDHQWVERRFTEVMEKYGGVIDTPEAFQEFLGCFKNHPFDQKDDSRSRCIPPRVRKKVIERDGEACVICGSEDSIVLDHIKPFSRGGRHTATNLRVLCRSCNSSKGDKTDEEWLGNG